MLTLGQIEVQAAQGKSIAVACKEAGICEQSYDRWRKEYGGPRPSAFRISPSTTFDFISGLPGDRLYLWLRQDWLASSPLSGHG